MPADHNTSFIANLREHGSLAPAQWAEIPPELLGPSDDPRKLAKFVVQRGWLTRYQVNEIVNGRGADLTLGQYRLLDRLGEGGMGQVFKAHHGPMDRIIALKLIREDRLEHPDVAWRFQRELKAAGDLVHPNIVLAYDAGQLNGTHYLAMEFIEGVDLWDLVTQAGPLPINQACDYIRQAALGLQHAHERGLVHRDIKPSNLMVSKPGEVVKILDMGLCRLGAKNDDADSMTAFGKVLGTVAFISPEQAKSSHDVDIRSDLYSLGCTLFFLLTGRQPFQAETPLEIVLQHHKLEAPPVSQFRPGVPPGVEGVVSKLLAKKPADRFQTPAEVARALEPFCIKTGPSQATQTHLLTITTTIPTGRSPVGNSATMIDRPATPVVSKRRLPWFAIASIVLLGVIGLALLLVKHKAETTETTTNVAEDTARVTRPVDTNRDTPREAPLKPIPAVLPDLPVRNGPGLVQRFDGYFGVVAFAPSGRLAVSSCADNSLRIWDVGSGTEHRRLVGHTGIVTSVAFSHDGRLLLSGSQDHSVRLWDIAQGKLLRRFEGHLAPVHAVALSRDQKHVLSCSGRIFQEDKKEKNGKIIITDIGIRLWNAQTAEEIRRFEGVTMMPTSIAFSPDGLRAVSGGWDKKVRLWDTLTGQEIRQMDKHRDAIMCVAFASDGQRILSGSRDRTLRLWNAENGQELLTCVGHQQAVSALAVSADGRRAISGSLDHTLRVWDLTNAQQLNQFDDHQRAITSVSLSPDGRNALSADANRAVLLWQLPPSRR